ncbi:MAG: hypothetical protein UT90_C0002G0017 [Parcubacteria group bacterium GW2011_GWA1_40_21]|nr:MAG: hypothetical protein UT80_C0001G0010 [Parcubacteria group bacterium GW2011_GWC1_40_13]KKR54060.1 MAG: hypothetical protein UT90_C0002G0017 [Parcubacteria group bacterium GW2011_GWA1_40_21]
MSNKSRKVGFNMFILGGIIILEFIFLARPSLESVIIWLPSNYELKNDISNDVVSVMPYLDPVSQSDDPAVYYSLIDLDSFKKLTEGNGKVTVKIESEYSSYFNNNYRLVYQIKYWHDNKKTLLCGPKIVMNTREEYQR